MNKTLKKRNLFFILSNVALLAACMLLAATYAWFIKEREMSTAVWVKTPIILEIGAGDGHDIQYLDMGDIDVGTESGYKDYVICVHGKPIDNYSLQLAYTTNIPFHYDVYRADKLDGDNEVIFQYKDSNNEWQKEAYTIRVKDDKLEKVIDGFSMKEILDKGEPPQKYQSHKLSYGNYDDVNNSNNIVNAEKVQLYNEPLYFLAMEDDVSVMKPINTSEDGSFLDYYIIRVSWKKGEVSNNKETDIVYLTASR